MQKILVNRGLLQRGVNMPTRKKTRDLFMTSLAHVCRTGARMVHGIGDANKNSEAMLGELLTPSTDHPRHLVRPHLM